MALLLVPWDRIVLKRAASRVCPGAAAANAAIPAAMRTTTPTAWPAADSATVSRTMPFSTGKSAVTADRRGRRGS
jgi:hypothetical protein